MAFHEVYLRSSVHAQTMPLPTVALTLAPGISDDPFSDQWRTGGDLETREVGIKNNEDNVECTNSFFDDDFSPWTGIAY